MRTGLLDGNLNNLNAFKTVYDSGELAAATTTVTISGLDGDTDLEYMLVSRIISNYAGSQDIKLRLNNDSGNNYGYQRLSSYSTTTEAARNTGLNCIYIGSPTASGNCALCITRISAKSGFPRLALYDYLDRLTSSTIGFLSSEGAVWNNTADNLTSLVITASQSNGIGIGSRFILLKKNKSTSGKRIGAITPLTRIPKLIQKIYKTTLGSAVTSVTISGLDGNNELFYRIALRVVGGSASGTFCYLRPNNDSGSNYRGQGINGNNASIASFHNDSMTGIFVIYNNIVQNEVGYGEGLLFSKSGYLRTFIGRTFSSITGTTVTAATIQAYGWNDTSNNITSLVIEASNSNGLGTNSVIELDALK